MSLSGADAILGLMDEPSELELQPPPAVPVTELRKLSCPMEKKVPLPVEELRPDFLSALQNHSVVIVKGPTGCGKSTQIPQFILDDADAKGMPVSILVTQPRRIATRELASRVAGERSTPLGGDQVGFCIGGHTCRGPATRLVYLTTGVLTAMLMNGGPGLASVTHLILDEVHERTVEMDLALALIKEHFWNNGPAGQKIKLVLMSATVDTSALCNYFGGQVPCLELPATNRAHQLDIGYLTDITRAMQLDQAQLPSALWTFDPARPRLTEERQALLERFVRWLGENFRPTDGVLVFLPGIASIDAMYEALTKNNPRQQICILHSSYSIEQQQAAVGKAPPGRQKVILSTNIAESSVTIPDVRVVVDCCLQKEIRWDARTQSRSLDEAWISKDAANQRAGRAGRCRHGYAYRLVPPDFFEEQLQQNRTPEILQAPLNEVLLRLVAIDGRDPKRLLDACINPPDTSHIGAALTELEDLLAIVKLEDLLAIVKADSPVAGSPSRYAITPLGYFMADMPLGIHSALLLAYGHVFGLLPEAVLLASIQARANPILHPVGTPLHNHYARVRYTGILGASSPEGPGRSDALAAFNAIHRYRQLRPIDLPAFIAERRRRQQSGPLAGGAAAEGPSDDQLEAEWCRERLWVSLFWIREIEDMEASLTEKLVHLGLLPPDDDPEKTLFLQTLLVASSLPTLLSVTRPPSNRASRLLSAAPYNPLTSVELLAPSGLLSIEMATYEVAERLGQAGVGRVAASAAADGLARAEIEIGGDASPPHTRTLQ
ncbi:putative ATP-dependent RNA helicase dhx29 [Paratrimastix pyriformis]|uniref:ATP-dependent RNA helicase dhx29 n=1 Tax=Paratrimastix pyriformis TaxID=342808 RepID=A0ABQ8UI04_9EUKA|nr:putative ATP-dependent RNA helicase dhx29 [Paratrimastix pyriformis]